MATPRFLRRPPYISKVDVTKDFLLGDTATFDKEDHAAISQTGKASLSRSARYQQCGGVMKESATSVRDMQELDADLADPLKYLIIRQS